MRASALALRGISIHALVKRATRLRDFLNLVTLNFNPRPREEGDQKLSPLCSSVAISIHALVKRATSNVPLEYEYTVISIHALVKRATTDYVFQTATRDFNPRPREEGD